MIKKSAQNQGAAIGNRPLIVSYSYSGNTHRIAQAIQNLTNGDWSEIYPWQPYPMAFPELLEQVKQEIQSGYKPRLLPGFNLPKHYCPVGADLRMVGTGNGDWFSHFRFCQRLYSSCFSLTSWQETGIFRDYSSQCIGCCVSAVYVRHNPYCRIFFPRRHERQLVSCVYDVLHPAEPATHHLQCGTRWNGLSCAYCFLLSLRYYCRVAPSFFYRDKPFFNFSGFDEPKSRDTDPNLLIRYLKNLWRNIRSTGPYFFIGILLSALFQRYVPAEAMTILFGKNEALGVLMAATIGVPLYACGGGTIPLLQQWLWDGMSVGSAASFMLTGPSTKITNLGALKIVLGMKRFLLYLAYVMVFSFITGLVVNLIV